MPFSALLLFLGGVRCWGSVCRRLTSRKKTEAPRPLGNARIISTRVESRLLQTSSKLEKEEVEVKGERKKFFLPRVCVDVLDFFPPPNHSPPPHFAIWKFLRHRPEKGEGEGKGGKVVCGHGDDMGPASRHQGICIVSLEFFAQHETAEKMVHGGGREHNANSAQKSRERRRRTSERTTHDNSPPAQQ